MAMIMRDITNDLQTCAVRVISNWPSSERSSLFRSNPVEIVGIGICHIAEVRREVAFINSNHI